MTKYDERVFVDGLEVIGSEARRLESLAAKMMDLIVLRGDEVEVRRENLKAVIGEMEAADNAIKASSAQGLVTIRVYNDNERRVVEVADQGIGMSQAHLAHIFEPFYVADKARTRKSNGAGLGLSICHSIERINRGRSKSSVKMRPGQRSKRCSRTGKRKSRRRRTDEDEKTCKYRDSMHAAACRLKGMV